MQSLFPKLPAWLRSAGRSSTSPRQVVRQLRLESLETRELLTAGLQVIHNSPYAAAAVVDVYVNDALALDNVAFRDATPYLDLPAGVDLNIDITAATAPDNSNPVFSTTLNLTDGVDYIAVAAGDPAATSGPTAFGLVATDIGRRAALNPANAEFLVFHGSPDAPTVDVVARGVGTLVDDISFPTFDADYLSVPAASYTLDVTLQDGSTRVASFTADLSAAGGAAFVVLASGFAVPQAAGDPAFGLLVVFADGDTALLTPNAATVTGTESLDLFTARVKASDPGVLEVVSQRGTTSFLIATNPVVTISGRGGPDTLTVYAPENHQVRLPQIVFDGGRGVNALAVVGTSQADTITLNQASPLTVNINGNLIVATSIVSANVYARAGNDTIDARGVRTLALLLYGDEGNDSIQGGQARDLIFGGDGNDWLWGNGGNDALTGGAGDDHLFGGAGLDLLLGGLGSDNLDGNRRVDSRLV